MNYFRQIYPSSQRDNEAARQVAMSSDHVSYAWVEYSGWYVCRCHAHWFVARHKTGSRVVGPYAPCIFAQWKMFA